MITAISPRIENRAFSTPQNKTNNKSIPFSGHLQEITQQKRINFFTELVKCCLDDPTFIERHRQIIGDTLAQIMPRINAGLHNNESGMRGFVSRLDDQFVLKAPHWFKKATPEGIQRHCAQGKVHKNKFEAIQDYYGHHVMTFGDIAIMKNATAPGNYVRVGRPFEMALDDGGFEYYSQTYLPTCAELPQDTFDRLAKNLKTLNGITSGDFHYEPDTLNPNNFLIFNDQIRIVDDMDPIKLDEPNTLTTMLRPLINNTSTDEKAVFSEELVPLRRKIFKKSSIASVKNDLPLASSFREEAEFEETCQLSGIEKQILKLKQYIADRNIDGIKKILR
ncbi:MAG: hypothetical protein NC390_02620 [Fusobacterium sp.]|nr:hypothetical protein [Fusobacterium sp.]